MVIRTNSSKNFINMENLTRDDLQYKGKHIYQPKNGYRSSEDSLILQNCILEQVGQDFSGKAFEFGTGSGLISILLGLKIKKIKITAIEIQPAFVKIAQKNVLECTLPHKITILNLDVRKVKSRFSTQSFDLCFANPPFYQKAKGRLSPNKQKQIARHEILCTMEDVLESFSYLLKNGSPGFIIYPLHRLVEFKQKVGTVEKLGIRNLRYFKNVAKEINSPPRSLTTKHSFCAELIKR